VCATRLSLHPSELNGRKRCDLRAIESLDVLSALAAARACELAEPPTEIGADAEGECVLVVESA
jgi:hypothetical protein